MKLEYENKVSEKEVLCGVKAKFSKPLAKNTNALIYGDNLSSMRTLVDSSIRFDLCYIDPPFATGSSFHTSKNRSTTVSKSSKDVVAYKDHLQGEEFLEFIRQRAILIRELLTENGSFYLHIDYKIGHYVKAILDEVFGIENFRNDITRIKCNPKNFNRKAFGNVKDLILFYTKGKDSIWNEPRSKLTNDDIKTLFKKEDKAGRRYTTVPIHAPGETKDGATGKIWKGMHPPKGRHWRSSPAELDKLDEAGLIEWSSTGNARRIIFADEHKGKKTQDIWNFKDPAYPKYPTEKNSELLEFIIQASSNKNSFVLDCFCGSGTTLLASEILERKWVGIDESKEAIKASAEKLDTIAIMDSKLNYQHIIAK